jgi:hypothetical protein
VGEGIDNSSDDVKGEKHERHQCEVAVQARGEEPGPSGRLHAQRGKNAEHNRTAQEDERDGTRAAGCVPEKGVVHCRQRDPPETTIGVPDEDVMGFAGGCKPEGVIVEALEPEGVALDEVVVVPGIV